MYKQFWQKGNTFYYVSKYGNVFSTAEPESHPATWHLIATYNGKGYRRVRLQGRTFKVHRLVAEAFVPNPRGGSLRAEPRPVALRAAQGWGQGE